MLVMMSNFCLISFQFEKNGLVCHLGKFELNKLSNANRTRRQKINLKDIRNTKKYRSS